MSKMGISVLSSYRGAYNFEAVGLSRTWSTSYFPACRRRISGIGLAGIQKKLLELHARAWSEDFIACRWAASTSTAAAGERHAWEAS